MSLKVEEDHELNIVFTDVTRISARRHFWGYKLTSWCFGLRLVCRVKYQSFKVEEDLLESALERNSLISAVVSFRLSSCIFVVFRSGTDLILLVRLW